MRAPFILAVSAVASILAAGAAWACSCVEFQTARQQLDETELAFIGRAVSTLPETGPSGRDGWVVTRFEVTRTLKGPHQAIRRIAHMPGNAAPVCGVGFARGREALVFANARDGRMATGLCTQPQFPTRAFERLTRR